MQYDPMDELASLAYKGGAAVQEVAQLEDDANSLFFSFSDLLFHACKLEISSETFCDLVMGMSDDYYFDRARAKKLWFDIIEEGINVEEGLLTQDGESDEDFKEICREDIRYLNKVRKILDNMEHWVI